MNTEITPLTYATELAAVSTFIVIATVTAMISGSALVAIVPITAVLLFESAVTAWRLDQHARIEARHSEQISALERTA